MFDLQLQEASSGQHSQSINIPFRLFTEWCWQRRNWFSCKSDCCQFISFEGPY